MCEGSQLVLADFHRSFPFANIVKIVRGETKRTTGSERRIRIAQMVCGCSIWTIRDIDYHTATHVRVLHSALIGLTHRAKLRISSF